MVAIVNKETCTGCGDCADTCPVEAITIADEKASVSEDLCADCAACTDACPTGSIKVD